MSIAEIIFIIFTVSLYSFLGYHAIKALCSFARKEWIIGRKLRALHWRRLELEAQNNDKDNIRKDL